MPRSRFSKLYFFHGALQLVSLYICVIIFFTKRLISLYFFRERAVLRAQLQSVESAADFALGTKRRETRDAEATAEEW